VTITPVTPVDRERLVPVNTGLLIDAIGETVAQVVVDGVVVWNGSSAQNSWSGFTITLVGGERLVLDPPSTFTVGQVVSVVVGGTVTSSVSYIFQCGLEQITTGDDASAPTTSTAGPAATVIPDPTWHLELDQDVPSAGGFLVQNQGGVTYQPTGAVGQSALLSGSGQFISISSPNKVNTPIVDRVFNVNAPVSMTDFVLLVTINTAELVESGLMPPDFGVRWLLPGDIDCPYWIEPGLLPGETNYWVKIPALDAGDTALRMRTNLAGGYISHQDPENTFLFFDDFNGSSIDAAKWTVTGSGFSVSGGDLVGGSNAVNYLLSTASFSTPVVVRTRVFESQSATNGFTTIGLWNSSTDGYSILTHDGVTFFRNDFSWGSSFPFSGFNVEVVDEIEHTGAQARGVRSKSGQVLDHGLQANVINGERVFLGARHDLVSFAQSYVCRWRHVTVRKRQPASAAVEFVEDIVVGTNPSPGPDFNDPLKAQVFSVSGWINPSSGGILKTILSCGRGSGGGWAVKRNSAGQIQVHVNGSSVKTANTILANGQWSHVTACVDAPAGSVDIIINGVSDVTTRVISPTTVVYPYQVSADDDMTIGRDVESPSQDFAGGVDDWRYFQGTFINRGLSSRLWQLGAGPQIRDWIGYSRLPGDVYVRRMSPTTSETLMVPGDRVDVGYNPQYDEVEYLYSYNGKVFVTGSWPWDQPSTLSQPTPLKNHFAVGRSGDGVKAGARLDTFPPVKRSVPIESIQRLSGAGGDCSKIDLITPPGGGVAAALGDQSPVVVFVPSPNNDLVTSYRIYRQSSSTGSRVFVVEIPYNGDNPVFYFDQAFLLGDGYLVTVVYGDPGARARRRESRLGPLARSGPGDLVFTGRGGDTALPALKTTTLPPLKRAVPTELVSGLYGAGDSGRGAVRARGWFSPAGAAASISQATPGATALVQGLAGLGARSRGLDLVVSGSTFPTNNGRFRIVDVLSATQVRIWNPLAVSPDAGPLTWSLSLPQYSEIGVIVIDTTNVGVG